MDGPRALDERYHFVLTAPGANVYRQVHGRRIRWAVHDPDSGWAALVDIDGRRVTAYPLKGKIPRSWELKWPLAELKSL